MSLSKGTGPFGEQRAGVGNFTIDAPKHILYFDPSPKRVRVYFNNEVIADSTNTKLLHETGHLPVYYFPLEDVRSEFLEPSGHATLCPFKGQASHWSIAVGDQRSGDAVWGYEDPIDSASFLRGHAAFYFDRVQSWYEEDDQIFVHPRDPYSRIDILSSSRHVRVSLDGQLLAESSHPKILFETSLPPRFYIPKQEVRMDLFEVSGHITQCAYKGQPIHFSAPGLGDQGRNIAWCYEEPNFEAVPVKGLVAFYNERVDLEVEGTKLVRPQSSWSRPD
jgi:uncharacterized protein (DUF427 family)